MSLKTFNSLNGYSVGANADIDVIDINGNVAANSLSVTNEANLGNVANIKIDGGLSGYYLQTDGTGNLEWVVGGGSGNGETGGGNTSIQFNDAGNFGGTTAFTFNKTTNTVAITGNLTVANGKANLGAVGNVIIAGGNSGQFLQTNGNGTLSWASQTIANINRSSILFNAESNGNSQTFTNANLTVFSNNNSYAQLFFNGVLMNTSEYSLSGNVLTVNRYLHTNDQIVVGPLVQSVPVPGANTQIVFNNAGNFDATPAFTYDVVSNVVTISDELQSGNIIPLADDTYYLGNSTNRWANLWLGPGTIYITDSANTANVAELTVSDGILQVNGATGLQANLIAGNSSLTLAPSGNIAMSVGGTSNVMIVTNTGANIVGNTTVGNLTVTGNISYDKTYGCFHKMANITAASANSVYSLDWYTDTTVHVGDKGVTVTSGQPTRINIDHTGEYTAFLEMQAQNAGTGSRTAWIWLAKNGTNITETTIQVDLLKQAKQVISKLWLLDDIVANDYIEVRFAVDNATNISLDYSPAQTTPFSMPAQPSATITIVPVGA